jgi:hypothetical protein
MRRSLCFEASAAVALSLGCATDVAVGGGWMPESGHAVAFGRSAVSTRPFSVPINHSGPLLGLAAEERAEEEVGSRFQAGLIAGYSLPPYWLWDTFAPELYAEVGTPLRSTLFERWDSYFSVGAGLPFPLNLRRDVQDVNRSIWILKYRSELVPFLRLVVHNVHDTNDRLDRQLEFTIGVSIRPRLASDLF